MNITIFNKLVNEFTVPTFKKINNKNRIEPIIDSNILYVFHKLFRLQ
jgi:hypothetical protein